jgi:hypothetical protein
MQCDVYNNKINLDHADTSLVRQVGIDTESYITIAVTCSSAETYYPRSTDSLNTILWASQIEELNGNITILKAHVLCKV